MRILNVRALALSAMLCDCTSRYAGNDENIYNSLNGQKIVARCAAIFLAVSWFLTCTIARSQTADRYSEVRVQAKILAERCVDSSKREQCVLYIWAILDTLTTMAPEQACFPIGPHPTAGGIAYSKEIYVGAIKALVDTARYAPTAPAADVVTRYLAETYKCH
jgi:hypothetical protein